MDLLLGLDIGSKNIKANFYDVKGRLVSGGSKPTLLSHPDDDHPNWSEWDPDIIWGAVKDSISSALEKLDLKGDIRSVSVTGFGMDGVPIDKSVSETIEETKKCLEIGMTGGGYILSSSNSIHSAVKPENYQAMLETLKRYGKY